MFAGPTIAWRLANLRETFWKAQHRLNGNRQEQRTVLSLTSENKPDSGSVNDSHAQRCEIVKTPTI